MYLKELKAIMELFNIFFTISLTKMLKRKAILRKIIKYQNIVSILKNYCYLSSWSQDTYNGIIGLMNIMQIPKH